MDWNRHIGDPRNIMDSWNIMKTNLSPSPLEALYLLDGGWRAMFPRRWQQDARPECPAFVVMLSTDILVVALVGVTHIEHIPRLVSAFNQGFTAEATMGANIFFARAAEYVHHYIDMQHIRYPRKVKVIGYSLGAGVATVFATFTKQLGRSPDVECVTYGAPRPGNMFFADACERIRLIRYFNLRDPVVRIPPRTDEAPVFHSTNVQAIRRNWDHHCQPSGGVGITDDSAFQYTVNSTLNLPLQDLRIIEWMGGLNGVVHQDHNVVGYERRMGPIPAAPWHRLDDPIVEGHTIPREETGPRTHGLAPAIVQDTIRTDAIVQAAILQKLPDAYLMHAVLTLGQWHVVWLNKPICIAPKKQLAKRIARAGNLFLSRFHRVGLASPGNLLEAMQEYMTEAARAGGKFIPPLSTPENSTLSGFGFSS